MCSNHICVCVDNALSNFQEPPPSILTSQQEKITLLAMLAFVLLATYYLMESFCFSRNGEGKIVEKCQKINNEQHNKELQGKGKLFLPSGFVLEGYFCEGKLHGKGKMTMPDREIRIGQFESNRFCSGKIIRPDNVMLQGIFSAKGYLLHGKMICSDRSVMVGKFWDVLNQQGYLKQGKITFGCGTTLIGKFANCSRLEEGVMTDAAGNIIGKIENKNTLLM